MCSVAAADDIEQDCMERVRAQACPGVGIGVGSHSMQAAGYLS